MGFEGHAMDMVNRMRQNRALLQSKRDQMKKVREMYVAHYTMKTSKVATPDNLMTIKEDIRHQLEAKRRKARILTIGIMIILLIVLIYLISMIPLQNFSSTFLN